MALTQKRMENCRKNHKGCIVATSKVEFVSKRLIEIHDGEANDLWIKLVVFCEMRKLPQTMKQRELLYMEHYKRTCTEDSTVHISDARQLLRSVPCSSRHYRRA
jgi:hypothetical protein